MTRNFRWSTKKQARLLVLASAWAWSLGCSASKDGSAARADAADAAASSACPVVQTAQGAVMGDGSNHACTYLGIPFAAPPTGNLRWKPPQSAAAWTTPRPSTNETQLVIDVTASTESAFKKARCDFWDRLRN
jgi:hypothetical protein